MTSRQPIDQSPNITARPKDLSEEMRSPRIVESGLSVDADELGLQFLKDATDQGNFESERGGALSDLSLGAAGPSDEALSGPN